VLVAIGIGTSVTAHSSSDGDDQPSGNQTAIMKTYGESDLSAVESFKGGYINFGYWDNIPNGQISEADRIKASENLYKLIHDELDIANHSTVLEIGCGLGNGCRLLSGKVKGQNVQVIGIDLTPQQIDRANERHQEQTQSGKLKFMVSSATNLAALKDESVDMMYSVEILQYLNKEDMKKFAHEAYRVLKPGGKLAITAHFSRTRDSEDYENLKKLIPTVEQQIDLMIPIQDVREAFSSTAFEEQKFYSIGDNVFPQFNQWVSQVNEAKWVKDIFTAYDRQYMDYYVTVNEKIK